MVVIIEAPTVAADPQGFRLHSGAPKQPKVRPAVDVTVLQTLHDLIYHNWWNYGSIVNTGPCNISIINSMYMVIGPKVHMMYIYLEPSGKS